MLLLLGLMGVLAIGATALVWFETAPRGRDDAGDAAAQTAGTDTDTKTPAETPDDDLMSMGAGLLQAAPPVAPNTYIHEMDDPFRGGGWLDDDEEDEIGSGNAAPVAFDAAPYDSTKHESEERAEPPQNALMRAHQENVTGFAPGRDRLVVVFDDHVDPNPRLGLTWEEADEGRTHITLNGVRIASVDVTEGLTLDDITLVPESSLNNPAHVPPASAAA